MSEAEVEMGTELGSGASGTTEEEAVAVLQRKGDPTTAKEWSSGSVCCHGVGDIGTAKERTGDGERGVGVVGRGEVMSGMGEGGCGEKGKDADCRGSGICGERGKGAGARDLNFGAGAKSLSEMEDS